MTTAWNFKVPRTVWPLLQRLTVLEDGVKVYSMPFDRYVSVQIYAGQKQCKELVHNLTGIPIDQISNNNL
jgi:hypothetical protein